MHHPAHIDLGGPFPAAAIEREARAAVSITVRPQDPPVERADFVRIDAGHLPLHEIAGIRAVQHSPVLLDLPGSKTRRRSTMLTRSELLFYAASESYEWVNLRDIRGGEELQQARELLPDGIRLSASTGDLQALADWPRWWWSCLDVLILDSESDESRLFEGRGGNALDVAMFWAARQGVPCFLMGSLLPSLHHPNCSQIEEVGRLANIVRAGCAGLILEELPPEGRGDSQLAVDVLRLVTHHSPRRTPRFDSPRRPAARVGAPQTASSPEASPPREFD